MSNFITAPSVIIVLPLFQLWQGRRDLQQGLEVRIEIKGIA